MMPVSKKTFDERLGFRILQAREERKIRGSDMAERLGCKPSYIQSIEAGTKNVSAYLLTRIEQIVGPIERGDLLD